jgi:hypothetical protein
MLDISPVFPEVRAGKLRDFANKLPAPFRRAGRACQAVSLVVRWAVGSGGWILAPDSAIAGRP